MADVPESTLRQWAMTVSRLSGALAGAASGFETLGQTVPTLRKSEGEGDALVREINDTILRAYFPAQGAVQ